jgi:hypothetical protein
MLLLFVALFGLLVPNGIFIYWLFTEYRGSAFSAFSAFSALKEYSVFGRFVLIRVDSWFQFLKWLIFRVSLLIFVQAMIRYFRLTKGLFLTQNRHGFSAYSCA